MTNRSNLNDKNPHNGMERSLKDILGYGVSSSAQRCNSEINSLETYTAKYDNIWRGNTEADEKEFPPASDRYSCLKRVGLSEVGFLLLMSKVIPRASEQLE